MTTFLVVSDNHGFYDELVQLVADYRDKVDYIIHCGDSECPSNDTLWTLVDSSVKGNMDFDAGFPVEDVLTTEMGKVYTTHGHLVGVNGSRHTLASRAKENHARIAFYGHTHELRVEEIDGVLCINPGSFNHSRGSVPKRTFALVQVKDTEVSVQYYDHQRQHLETLDCVFSVN